MRVGIDRSWRRWNGPWASTIEGAARAGGSQSIHSPAITGLVTRSGTRYDTTDLVCRSGMYKSGGGIAISWGY